jgi:hypothetical protein
LSGALTLQGLSRAWGARRLIGLVWVIHTSVAAAAAFPFWRVLSDVLAPLPEADVLGSALRLGALADLAELRPGLLPALGVTIVLTAVVGFVLGAGIVGGVLEVLGRPDEGPLGPRFGRGIGRFFGRFLRVGLLVVAGATILGALAVLPFVHLTRLHFRAGWDTALPGVVGGAAVVALVALLALLVLDASRLVLVRTDGRVLASLGAGLRLVLGHPVAWCGVWLLNGALVAVAVGLYLSFRWTMPAPTGLMLLVVVAGQQAFVMARITLRIALLASESALVERLCAQATERPPRSQPVPSSPPLPPA